MRLPRHLTYANAMATIAVFGVMAAGSAYAVSKIGTRDIAKGAITANKLHAKAVKTSKLGSGAVTGGKLAPGAVETANLSQSAPVPLAGVVVSYGVIRSWFNRFNDQEPILSQAGPGVYDLEIPGLSESPSSSSLTLLSSVSLSGPGVDSGEVTSRWTQDSAGGDLHPIISTFNSAGSPEDKPFTYLVYPVEHFVQ
jgi:hypothetical protein